MITPLHPHLTGITPPDPLLTGITPPHPLLTAPLLTAAAKLSFLITLREESAELGVMVDESGAIHHLTMQGGETDGTWTLVPVIPEDFGHFLLSRDTFEILHRGTLNNDGSVTLDEQSYRIRAAINGGRLTAKAIPLGKAAT